MKSTTKLWIIIGVLAVLSPLGILLPQMFHSGAAWGEWDTKEMHGLVGYVPKGLEKLSGLWRSILPDYAIKGWEDKGQGHLSLAYVVSAFVGIVLCVGVGLLVGRILAKKEKTQE